MDIKLLDLMYTSLDLMNITLLDMMNITPLNTTIIDLMVIILLDLDNSLFFLFNKRSIVQIRAVYIKEYRTD